ncbi:hypothetical protein [Streptomyces sp. AC495_CC817]|uniref:hypothetical protein n=1 Tax=Streptomyces sp. AC495_CC817 TaxID=2823900 RepID=UPI001C281395|nr:hypothetical protein [Streptomyces sp. AC495_CC817]
MSSGVAGSENVRCARLPQDHGPPWGVGRAVPQLQAQVPVGCLQIVGQKYLRPGGQAPAVDRFVEAVEAHLGVVAAQDPPKAVIVRVAHRGDDQRWLAT